MPALSRRAFTLSAAGLLGARIVFAQAKNAAPITGMSDPNLVSFDTLMAKFIDENGVPGAALAVSRRGKLVYARGFGLADSDKKTPVQPTSLFRIASVSKPITAVAVLKLVEQKKLKLDAPVATLMNLKAAVPAGEKLDSRWNTITVRQCLQHTAGWDRDKSFDPIGRPWDIARALGKKPPVPPADVIRYMMGQSLDFEPGRRAVYSNLGYLVLGRIVAQVSGTDYEAFVRKEIFSKLGVKSAQLGKALPEKRPAREVSYTDSKKRMSDCLYPPRQGQKVPLPDGGENFEAFEAHGGCVASAVDLVRFASAFEDPAKSPLLSEKTIAEMWARPAGQPGEDDKGKPKAWYLGCGWLVRPLTDQSGRLNAWHTGYIAGTEALMVRRYDGLSWAVLFNTNDGAGGQSLAGRIDSPLHCAADAVKQWPDADQFPMLLK